MVHTIYSLVLLVMGVVCVAYYASGMIVHYVNTSFQLASLVGGLGMFVIGAFQLFTARKASCCGHDHCDDEHAHTPIGAVLCLLIVPLLMALLLTEHKPSSKMLDRKSAVDVSPSSMNASLDQTLLPVMSRELIDQIKTKNANGAYQMQVSELFYSAGDPEVASIYEGLRVETSGQVRSQPGEENDPSVKRLYRMFVTCCATDMQPWPVKLKLSPDLVNDFDFAEHAWVLVEGSVSYEEGNNGMKQAVILIDKIEPSEPPNSAFLLRDGGRQ